MPYVDKEKKKQANAAWYQRRREDVIKRVAENRKKNPEVEARYRKKNAEKIKAQKREAYHSTDPETRRVLNALRWAREKARAALTGKKLTAHTRRWHKSKRLSDPIYRLKSNYRRRISKVLRRAGLKKSERTHTLLGCSPVFYRAFLETMFKPGMDWTNYGTVWSVDHVKPLALFDLSCPMQRSAAFHFTNTQPLFQLDNIRKGARYIHP